MDGIPPAILRFLERIQAAGWDGVENIFTPAALYVASTPDSCTQYQGTAAIVAELKKMWNTPHRWRITELSISPTIAGAIVDFIARRQCPGNAHHAPHEQGCRLVASFRIQGERIVELRSYCFGDRDESNLRCDDVETPKVRRGIPL